MDAGGDRKVYEILIKLTSLDNTMMPFLFNKVFKLIWQKIMLVFLFK